MGQREDVAASLMRGDSRDGCARRKVATAVHETVETGLRSVKTTHAEVAEAASAVVLASDLRAPAETRQAFIDRLTEGLKTGTVTLRGAGVTRTPCAHDGCPGMEWHEGRPDGCGHPTITDGCQGRASLDWRPMAMVAAARKWLKDAPESYHVDQASLCLDDLADALQGWRARLANVERLLSTYVSAVEIGDRDAEMGTPDSDVEAALAEVRAMLDEGAE